MKDKEEDAAKNKEENEARGKEDGVKDKEASWFPTWAANVGCGFILLTIAVGICIFIIHACLDGWPRHG
jgi:hypothetical protein